MNYISVTDTAKLVRQVLKEAFPGVKFSVRSSQYSGGASIRVVWIDGPCVPQVDEAVAPFRGATFDGMQDMKEYKRGTLDGSDVHFGADFIFPERAFSDDFISRLLGQVWKKYGSGDEAPTLEDYRKGNLWKFHQNGMDFGSLLYRTMRKRTMYPNPKKSKTFARTQK